MKKNAITGAGSELRVQHFFISNGWNVGKDFIDDGFDLYVEPSKEDYFCARFLVQVKGTAHKENGKVSTKVSRSRLREYSTAAIPVFIIRVTPQGKMYWTHAQIWAQQNSQKLRGSGEAIVTFDTENDLEDFDRFRNYLNNSLIAPFKLRESLAVFLAQRNSYLSSLDPHFTVRVEITGEHETVHIDSRSENAPPIQFRANDSDDAHTKLTEAMDFGKAVEIHGISIRMDNSPLADAIGLSSFTAPGTMSLLPADRAIKIYFRSGDWPAETSEQYEMNASLSSGARGFLIQNERNPAALSFEIRALKNPKSSISMNFRFELDLKFLSLTRLADATYLRLLRKWALRAHATSSALLTIRTEDGDETTHPLKYDLIDDFIAYCDVLGKLQYVCQITESDFKLEQSAEFSNQDWKDIDLAYRLISGESVNVTISDMEVTPTVETAKLVCSGTESNERIFRVDTDYHFHALGRLVKSIPIEITLSSYELRKNEGESKLYMSSTANSKAVMIRATNSHDPDDETT